MTTFHSKKVCRQTWSCFQNSKIPCQLLIMWNMFALQSKNEESNKNENKNLRIESKNLRMVHEATLFCQFLNVVMCG